MPKSQILASPFSYDLVRKEEISYIVLSDIHLGNKKVPISFIVRNLRIFFGEFDKDAPSVDVVFIAGDLFDQALWFTDEDLVTVILFIQDLMAWCERTGTSLRILEGTPSHDRNQPRNLVPIAKNFPNLNFRYIETMCVEAMYDLGITCLYCPDEFGGSAAKAQELIEQEFDKLQIKKVDIAILHGMFKYQLPEIASDRFKFDEQFFLDRVRYFINIGHVHKFSVFDRIISQGSFDRLAQREEEPKGGVLVNLNEVAGNNFLFIENKGAKIQKTITIRWKELDRAVAQVRAAVRDLPEESYVRIKAPRGHEIFNVYDRLALEYNRLIFDKITTEEEEEKKELLKSSDLFSVEYTPFNIDKENIVGLVLSEVFDNHDLSPVVKDTLRKKLEELV